MIILDENILDGQRLLLQAWRLAARQIGLDFGRKGPPFTRDAGFYQPTLRHPSYCIVWRMSGNEVAAFICRFLRHPNFDTRPSAWAE